MNLFGGHSKGWWAVVGSLVSFLIIHAVFYVAHESINAADPSNTFVYKLDRILEPVEKLPSMFSSTQDKLKEEITHVVERVEELEAIATLHTEKSNKQVASLLHEIEHELEKYEHEVVELVRADNNTENQALLLYLQSIVDHVHYRLVASQLVAESTMTEWNEVLLTLDALSTDVNQVAMEYQIDVDTGTEPVPERPVAITNTTPSPGLQAALIPTITPPEPEEQLRACMPKLSSCTTNEDCCADEGLVCQPTINSNGQRVRRCMPNIGIVCEKTCEEGALVDTRCSQAIIFQEMDSCKSLNDSLCSALNPEQNEKYYCTK